MEAAARIVIGEWNSGRIRHYATPASFDPSVLVDVDALRKELMDNQDAEDDDGNMLEEETKGQESAMNVE